MKLINTGLDAAASGGTTGIFSPRISRVIGFYDTPLLSLSLSLALSLSLFLAPPPCVTYRRGFVKEGRKEGRNEGRKRAAGKGEN